MKQRVITFLFGVLLVSFCAGCGYTLQGGGSILPPDVKKIYIPFVQNDSTEGGIANIFTESLRDQFERFGVVEIVDDAQNADATLNARIKSIKRISRAVTSKTEVAVQYDVTMLVSATLKKKNGSILYRDENLSLSSAYGAAQAGVVASSSDFAQGVIGASSLDKLDSRQLARSQEQQALEQIASIAAARIYQDAVSPDF